jgi:heptosyltransferase I
MKKPTYVLQTLDSDSHEAEKILQRRELEGRLLIGMHVSSSRAKHMERKCWARENFLSVARELHGKHSDLAILLFCGEEDRAESEWLRAQEPHLFHLIQGVPVRVVGELLKRCKLMLSNDSGLMHLASAVQTPLVALFGPTNPLRTGPWEHETACIVRTGHPCSPCFYHTSRDLTCPEAINFACLREITPEIVIASVEDMLQRCSRTNLSE